MFNVFFDICYVKNGVVTSRGVETMVAILNKAKVEVTVEELQPNVASLHPTRDGTRLFAEVEQLLTKFSEGHHFLAH